MSQKRKRKNQRSLTKKKYLAISVIRKFEENRSANTQATVEMSCKQKTY